MSDENLVKFTNNTRKLTELIISSINDLKKIDMKLFNDYSDLIGLLEALTPMFLSDQGTVLSLMKQFSTKLCENGTFNYIKNRDKDFLIDNIEMIFGNNPYNDRIKNLVKNNYISESNLTRLWTLIDAFIHNSTKYFINNKINPQRNNLINCGIVEIWGIKDIKI
jgi:hypothetical protein